MARGVRGRRTGVAGDDHDEVALSGWLFADLILGLLVVFLGAITIRYVAPPEEPEVAEEEVEAEEPLICATALDSNSIEIDLPRNASTDELVALTEQAIATAIAERENLGEDATFPLAFFFGRPETSDPSRRNGQASQFAREMSSRLLPAMPDRFEFTLHRDYIGTGSSNFVQVELFPQVTNCR